MFEPHNSNAFKQIQILKEDNSRESFTFNKDPDAKSLSTTKFPRLRKKLNRTTRSKQKTRPGTAVQSKQKPMTGFGSVRNSYAPNSLVPINISIKPNGNSKRPSTAIKRVSKACNEKADLPEIIRKNFNRIQSAKRSVSKNRMLMGRSKSPNPYDTAVTQEDINNETITSFKKRKRSKA